MPLIEWNESLSVGIAEFDNQHKELVRMLNELFDAMKVGKGNDVLRPILEKLSAYVVTHFNAEEKKLAQVGYPLYATHKQEHAALTTKLNDFKQKFTIGQAGLSVQLMNFLKDWLINHIKGTDMKYKEFLNSKGVR